MENEIWKDVPGYEGSYQVSNLGNVKSLARWIELPLGKSRLSKEKCLKQSLSKRGYYVLVLRKDNSPRMFNVHQLVVMAFLGHIPDGTQTLVVDHINGVRTDNNLSNLQVIRQRVNASKDRIGTSKYSAVHWNTDAKRWVVRPKVERELRYLGSYKDEDIAGKVCKMFLDHYYATGEILDRKKVNELL